MEEVGGDGWPGTRTLNEVAIRFQSSEAGRDTDADQNNSVQ
jgi:hypothetical protein